MFLGHFAVGLGAKRVAPEVSLGTLFVGGQLADLLWPNFVLLGWERLEIEPGATAVTPLDFVSYPYSHSLATLALAGLLLAGLYRLARRAPLRTGLVLALTVVSHWVLDVVSHRPDLPLAPGVQIRLGLGLWRSVPATALVEGALLASGVAIYLRTTRATDRTGRIAFAALIGFLALIYAANLFGPPPPHTGAVVWSAQAIWLLVAWAYWADRHRGARARQAASAG